MHLSPTIHGTLTVGPNAVLGFARERYGKGAVTPADVAQYLRFPGMWKLARANVRTGARELSNSLFKRGYLAQCRKYCPELTLSDLVPMEAGIRAQAVPGRHVGARLPAEDHRAQHSRAQRAVTGGHVGAAHRRDAGRAAVPLRYSRRTG